MYAGPKAGSLFKVTPGQHFINHEKRPSQGLFLLHKKPRLKCGVNLFYADFSGLVAQGDLFVRIIGINNGSQIITGPIAEVHCYTQPIFPHIQ